MTKETDERLKTEAPEDFDVVGQRASRVAGDRAATEDRELTEADRLEMFRNQLFNDALPDLPKIPGYHMCWLTTSNPRDPIHRRLQLGYTLLKPEEVPGMVYTTLDEGDYQGYIGVNEMVAAKLPQSLYEAFMHEAHHAAPLREEQKLKDVADMIRAQLEATGGTVDEGDGITELRHAAPRRGIFT